MADNSEAEGSQPRGEEPIEQNSTIQTFITYEVTKTLTSLFPTICESVRVWIEEGKRASPSDQLRLQKLSNQYCASRRCTGCGSRRCTKEEETQEEK